MLSVKPEIYSVECSVESIVSAWQRQRDSNWAADQFRNNVYSLIKRKHGQTVIEIGGGRAPMFSEHDMEEANATYIINDICQTELDLTPNKLRKLCFDICSKESEVIEKNSNSCSVMFSKMVFEHVPDALQAYKNIYTLLESGGVCLNFHPVLFSPPFVVNAVFPEALSAKLLRFIDPRRVETDIPKFPAYYSRCRVSARFCDQLKQIGFSKVWKIPFFYHNYFAGIPIVISLDRAISRAAESIKMNKLASYCYTCVLK